MDMMYMTRRDLMRFAGVAPLAALSDWQPVPVYQQFLPLAQLPQPSPPAGLGLGAPWQSGDNVPAMLERLRPAWWYDWRYSQSGAPGYVPMIWSGDVWQQNESELVALFDRRPDLFWLLWNEPERADQANMSPDEAAQLTAEIAAHGIQYAGPGVALTRDGYLWLHDYLAAGGPVPHCWHVHIYRCTTPEQWTAAWAAWVDWMTHYNVVRPTIVSETNAWSEGSYGHSVMVDHVDDMLQEEELLQAVGWFASRWDAWGAGKPALLHADGTLTAVGTTFAGIRAMRVRG